MISTRHTQSLTDFRQKATETIARLNESGDAEILTVNGVAKVVMLSPAVFDEMTREAQLAQDVAAIRVADAEFKAGKGRDMDVVFDELRAKLLRLRDKKRKRRGR